MKKNEEVTQKEVNSLKVFIDKVVGGEHSIKWSTEAQDDSIHDIHINNSLIIFNNKHLAISPSNLSETSATTIIEYLKECNLNENVIKFNFPFTSTVQIENLPNLISINLAIDAETKKQVTLSKLTSITIDKSNFKRNLANIKYNKSLISDVSIKSVNNNFDIDTLNKLTNLKNLSISEFNSKTINKKLQLPNLESFHSVEPYSISLLSECNNINTLAGHLDTTADYSKVKNKITNITYISEFEIDLNNINTEQLESLQIFSPTPEKTKNFPLKVNKKCNNLHRLIIHKFIPYHKNRNSIKEDNTLDFNLSLLLFFPKIKDSLISGFRMVDDTSSSIVFTTLRRFQGSNLINTNINFLLKMPNLKELELVHCEIESIDTLKVLDHLEQIDLTGNKIIDIPPELAKRFDITAKSKESNKGSLIIGNNPLISPPIEIVERGETAVRPYFDSMVGEMEELNEAKIIFLGNGEVGKTSLMKALSGQQFDAEEATTHGINICRYNVPINEQRSIDASIWDFGGQQIMHATHQLFLSRRCVYVLVINDRRDDLQQEQKIEYWLQQVQTFGDGSKIIIIRNKSDMFSSNNIPEGKLKEKFPNLVAIESVSCKTEDNIDRVKNLLNDQVRQLPMRKVFLAKNWIQIKEEIKALSHEKDHLPLSTYIDICLKHGVTDCEAQNTLRQLLHDLSVIIAFEELSDFDMGILNPHWITDGIYTIINSSILEGNKGYIKIAEAQKELDRVHPNKYVNKARFIIESMVQFELCHTVGSNKSNTYLVPNLLPNEIREHKLSSGKNTINFLFKYENLLPPSLFPKLLVRMNNLIASDKRWRTGAIITDVDTNVQSRIEVDSVSKELKITVTGEQARDFFTIIRHHIRNLHNPSAEALGARELVPLGNSGEYIDYEELIGLEVMGEKDYVNGKLKRTFSVSSLLNGIESRAETDRSVARQREDINVNVEVKTGTVNVTTGEITNTLTSSADQTQTATQSQNIEISIELKSLKGTADYVFEDLKDEAEIELDDESERIRFLKECDKVKIAMEQIEQSDTPEKANENLSSFSRVQDFLTSSLEGTGKVGDAMQSLGDNISKLRGVAKKYNKVAGFLGLPVVPEILL